MGKIDEILSRIVILKRFRPRERYFLAAAVLIVCVITPLVILGQPALSDRLEYFYGNWCVERIQINGRDTVPSTLGVSLVFKDQGQCMGNISFDQRVITFPEFNSYAGNARWQIAEDKLIIQTASEGAEMFEGIYDVALEGEVIRLKSENVYIQAHVVKIRLPF
jgi:hypothetical protein